MTFICDALETDWLVGAPGFEPLHFRIGIHPDSQPRGQDSHLRISNCKCAGSTLKKESQTLTGGPAPPFCTVKFSRSDFEMQRFESRHLSQAAMSGLQKCARHPR